MTFDLDLYLQGHLTLFWLGIQHDSIVWVIMRRRGVSSERRRSSCSSLMVVLFVCIITRHAMSHTLYIRIDRDYARINSVYISAFTKSRLTDKTLDLTWSLENDVEPAITDPYKSAPAAIVWNRVMTKEVYITAVIIVADKAWIKHGIFVNRISDIAFYIKSTWYMVWCRRLLLNKHERITE